MNCRRVRDKTFRAIIFALFVSSVLCLPVSLKRCTHSYHLSRLGVDLSDRPDWDVPTRLSSGEIARIFNQEFYYLDRGSQAFVFTSSDQNYVLKLFIFDSPFSSLSHRFFHRFDKDLPKRTEHRAVKTMQACKTAIVYAPYETGLIDVHLNLRPAGWPLVHLNGPAWHRETVALDRVRFALQRRARPLKQALLYSLNKGDRAAFCEQVDALLSMLKGRISSGIYNADPTLFENFGMIGKQAVEIDFGNYVYCPHLFKGNRSQEEKARYMNQLLKWVERHKPEWKDEVSQRIED